MKPITREDAIRVFNDATDKEDPFWESLMEQFLEDSDDADAPLPSIGDVFIALGVSESEYRTAVLRNRDPHPIRREP